MPFLNGNYLNYPASLNQGLLGWWTFDDGGAKDFSGHNNHGNLLGSIPPSPIRRGPFLGSALSFDGSNSHVDTPLNPSGLTTFSISAWVNHTSIAGSQRLIANSHTDSDNNGFQFSVGGNLTFSVGNGTTFAQIGGGSFVTGQWYHVAATLDIANNLMTTYIDGIQNINGTTITGTLSAGLNNTSFGFNPVYQGDFFSGLSDDIRIYNRLLSLSELSILSGLGRLNFLNRYYVGSSALDILMAQAWI